MRKGLIIDCFAGGGGTRDEDVMKALERKDDMQEWVMKSLKARIKAIREGERNYG